MAKLRRPSSPATSTIVAVVADGDLVRAIMDEEDSIRANGGPPKVSRSAMCAQLIRESLKRRKDERESALDKLGIGNKDLIK